MARKDVSVAEALAVLAAQDGIELTDAQKDALAKVAQNQMIDSARTVVANKLSVVENENSKTRNARVREFTSNLFALAESFETNIPGATQNRGQGQRTIRMIRVETPEGSLKVELSTE